jgi:hypothetical protein
VIEIRGGGLAESLKLLREFPGFRRNGMLESEDIKKKA